MNIIPASRLAWDGSYLGDITEELFRTRGPGEARSTNTAPSPGINSFTLRTSGSGVPWTLRYYTGKNNSVIKYEKVRVMEVQTLSTLDVLTDLLKGMFFLPQVGMHTGKVRMSAGQSDEELSAPNFVILTPESTELKTLASTLLSDEEKERYIDEIRRVIVFQWIFRLKVGGVNEDFIHVYRTETNGLCFTSRARDAVPNAVSDKVRSNTDELTKPILQKWFNGDIQIFSDILADMLRPYSRDLLKSRVERVIGAYYPDGVKDPKIKAWLTSVYNTVFPIG